MDPTDREEASEVVLAALTACVNTAVSASALVRGIELDELTTTVSVDWDPFVFGGLQPADDGEPDVPDDPGLMTSGALPGPSTGGDAPHAPPDHRIARDTFPTMGQMLHDHARPAGLTRAELSDVARDDLHNNMY